MAADANRSIVDALGPPGQLAPRRTAADRVADALRAAIDGGVLPDGAVLNTARLAEHFGVSRAPVREALRELRAEGRVVTQPYRQAIVSAPRGEPAHSEP